MLIVLFDMRGLVQVLKRVKGRVYRIRPDIADDWKRHHDKDQPTPPFS
jgi:hypothetical protein